MNRIQNTLLVAAIVTLPTIAHAEANSCLTPALEKLVSETAQLVVDGASFSGKKADGISRLSPAWPQLVAKTMAISHLESILAPLAGDVAEAVRTDKQLGAGSSSAGTTTLVDKPGISRLLALAIERGAIQQKTQGESVTLSSSPYALFALLDGDTPDTFRNHSWARKIGISGTFPLEASDGEGAGGFEPESFESITLRWNFGERSPRSAAFTDLWAEKVRAFDQASVDETADALTTLFKKTDALEAVDRSLVFATGLIAEGDLERDRVTMVVRDALCGQIYEKIRTGELVIPEAELAPLRESFAKQARFDMKANTAMKSALAEFSKRPSATATYTLHRVDNASDYSELKLIADGWFGGGLMGGNPLDGFSLVANAGVSLNHDPSRTPGGSLRSYGASIAIEKSVDNIIAGALAESLDQSRILLSLGSKVERLENINKMLVSGEVKITVPIVKGFSLPIAINYASRSETSSKDEFRVNLGVSFDSDKLMALARLAAGGF